MPLNYRQADREADFRAQLIHVHEHADSIALQHREPRLESRLLAQVTALIGNMRSIITVNRNVGFFTTGYNYLIQIIPALIVAPLFMGGEVPFGVITAGGRWRSPRCWAPSRWWSPSSRPSRPTPP